MYCRPYMYPYKSYIWLNWGYIIVNRVINITHTLVSCSLRKLNGLELKTSHMIINSLCIIIIDLVLKSQPNKIHIAYILYM